LNLNYPAYKYEMRLLFLPFEQWLTVDPTIAFCIFRFWFLPSHVRWCLFVCLSCCFILIYFIL
jgi:hypothetical protein